MESTKKEELILQFQQVADLMRMLGENDFKIRAYEKGADAIAESDVPLVDIAEGKVKIAGVGEGLKKAIKEFLQDGKISALEELSKDIPLGVFELMKLPGLGPKKAMAICEELQIQTIGELEYACRENRLVTLKGFGQAVQEKILKSIEMFNSNIGKFRIDEALERAEKIKSDIDSKAEWIHVGSLGRHSDVIEVFEFLYFGKEKFSGWKAHNTSFLDIKMKSYEKNLDVAVKVWLIDRTDYQNNQEKLLKWLCADQKMKDELENNYKQYQDWEVPWIETLWCQEKRKPKRKTYRIARDGNVKGVFHCHTNFSDGRHTLDEMVLEAQKLGYEYIGISDHSQSAFYAQGLKPECIKDQRKRIQELQKKVSIKIFHGIESDILAEGALDYTQDILDSFDFIVGSVHSRFKMTGPEMTKRLVAALSHPNITIWGHPTGRLLLSREGYSLDWNACFKAAKENNVAVELNANPQRLDIDWRMGAALEENKISVCINPDAHSMEGLKDTLFGEWMAEKAMVETSQILNLMNVNQMEQYLWDRKKKSKKQK